MEESPVLQRWKENIDSITASSATAIQESYDNVKEKIVDDRYGLRVEPEFSWGSWLQGTDELNEIHEPWREKARSKKEDSAVQAAKERYARQRAGSKESNHDIATRLHA